MVRCAIIANNTIKCQVYRSAVYRTMYTDIDLHHYNIFAKLTCSYNMRYIGERHVMCTMLYVLRV